MWRIVLTPELRVSLHDLQTRYDVSDLLDFHEAIDFLDANKPEPEHK